ncbi:MAG: NAD(P)/FAD-dependent oxidoreductase, partial [Acidimicrobiales bacterium]
MSTQVVVLGAGFGGLELTTRLSTALGDGVGVTLIDQNDSFVFGFAKLDVMFGRQSLDDVRLFYRDLAAPGVQFRQETVRSIDPVSRTVLTDKNSYAADILVVALGADLDPAATPGLVEGGYEFYSPAGADRARVALAEFAGGDIVIGVLGGFFKCPPAPNETAFLLDEYLTQRGVREQTTIHLVTPMPLPIPISQDTSAAIVDLLNERNIQYHPASRVTRLDPDAHAVHLADGGTVPCDLLLGIPVHCVPPVVVESGLTDDGWISVDTSRFATRFEDVYAIGDVTSAPVPRAGSIAE